MGLITEPQCQEINVLVLDCDGVITSLSHTRKMIKEGRTSFFGFFDPVCLFRLQKLICMDDKLRIVISSSWRKCDSELKKLVDVLNETEIRTRIIGLTPILKYKGKKDIDVFGDDDLDFDVRSMEIITWLQNTKIKINKVLILDDEQIKLEGYFIRANKIKHVRTSMWDGLSEENYIEAINFLAD